MKAQENTARNTYDRDPYEHDADAFDDDDLAWLQDIATKSDPGPRNRGYPPRSREPASSHPRLSSTWEPSDSPELQWRLLHDSSHGTAREAGGPPAPSGDETQLQGPAPNTWADGGEPPTPRPWQERSGLDTVVSVGRDADHGPTDAALDAIQNNDDRLVRITKCRDDTDTVLEANEHRNRLFPPTADSVDTLDDFLDELAPDEIDDYDPDPAWDEALSVDVDGAVSPEQRARQIALEVIDAAGWSPHHLPSLQELFFQNGWAATRMAVEREIARGMTPEELFLAWKIRDYWEHNTRYWVSFRGVKRSLAGQQSCASYRIMGWPAALRIVRCFSAYPDEEELCQLIEEAYLVWYESDPLRKRFKVFQDFLRVRLGEHRQTLPGACAFYFRDTFDSLEQPIASSDTYYGANEPLDFALRELGLWPGADAIRGMDP